MTHEQTIAAVGLDGPANPEVRRGLLAEIRDVTPSRSAIAEAVITGLASNMEEVGRPLCPCNFYPDKEVEIQSTGRRWFCACDEMKRWKYCHCLLFTTPEGLPITNTCRRIMRAARLTGSSEIRPRKKARVGRGEALTGGLSGIRRLRFSFT